MLGSDHAPGLSYLMATTAGASGTLPIRSALSATICSTSATIARRTLGFDSRVRPYQRDPVGRREKSTYVTRYRRPTFWAFRQMKLARRPLKEKRHRYPKDVRQLMKAAGANAVGALLVLLDLLERQSQTIR
jgi:hypothetical protein